MVTLNMSVAVAIVRGPQDGLAMIAPLESDPRVAEHHRVSAVKGHLLDLAGRHAEASVAFEAAARRTASLPEKRFLASRATALRQRAGVASAAAPAPPSQPADA
jgi:predicted RNA polymerase sigma factor